MPRTVTVTFDDGTTHTYEGVPDSATPDQVERRALGDFAGKKVTSLDGGNGLTPKPLTASATDAMAVHRARLAKAEEGLKAEQDSQGAIPTLLRAQRQIGSDFLTGVGDTALSLGRGIVAAPVAGIAGLARGAVNMGEQALGLPQGTPAADVVNNVQSTIAGQPLSDVGRGAQAIYTRPLSAFAKGADRAGQFVTDVTGSPMAGTMVNTAIQGAPALIAPETRGAFASVGKGIAARVLPEATGTAGAAAAAAPGVGSVPPGTAEAAQYAQSAGLDWDSLGASVQKQLAQIAASGGDLSKLPPDAVARLARMQSLPVPVPATRGQILRDPVQLRKEGNASATEAGAPIADRYTESNQALVDNLDVLKGKVSGTGTTAAKGANASDVGRAVQDTALGAKEAASKANYNALFKAARETEPDATASLAPVTQLLTENPEIQHLGWVQSWLNKAAKVKAPEGGEPVPVTDATLAELNDLRSKATAIAGTGGKEGYYAGQVKQAIDQAMQDVPAEYR